jgi:hypothetical protein
LVRRLHLGPILGLATLTWVAAPAVAADTWRKITWRFYWRRQHEQSLDAARSLGGTPPASYGYQHAPDHDPTKPNHPRVEPNHAEQVVIARAKALDAKGLNCAKVAAGLNEEGRRARNGQPFTEAGVRFILNKRF